MMTLQKHRFDCLTIKSNLCWRLPALAQYLTARFVKRTHDIETSSVNFAFIASNYSHLKQAQPYQKYCQTRQVHRRIKHFELEIQIILARGRRFWFHILHSYVHDKRHLWICVNLGILNRQIKIADGNCSHLSMIACCIICKVRSQSSSQVQYIQI